jgi:lysophospholipase L1-like esterase
MSGRLVALGDSFSCGEGVGVRVPISQAWSTVLARHAGLEPLPLARPGARVRDLREQQLPMTPQAPVATVLVGLNDVCRGAFDAARFADDYHALVDALLQRVDVVLVGRLHNPTQFLWVPKRLHRIVAARTAAINSTVDDVARGRPRVPVLDLASVEALQLRCAWAADGVHPTVFGHTALASAGAETLRETGHGVDAVDLALRSKGTTKVRHAVWLARYGVPYLALNARVFATPIAEGLRRAG